MTKMHFEYAAQLIRESDNAVDVKWFAARVFARTAANFNARFDCTRFYLACGLKDE